MSATRDKSQKLTFVYSNLYELYKKGVEAAKSAEIKDENPEAEPRPFGARPGLTTAGLTTSKIIKAESAEAARAYTPPSFTAKRFEARRVATPQVIHQVRSQQHQASVDSLKNSLQQLQGLHSRLKHMLGELEELVAADQPQKPKK